MGRESNRFVVARETSEYQYLLTEKIFIDGDSMVTNVPTDTKPSTATNPRKYLPPTLTTYGTVRELTNAVGAVGNADGGTTAPFVKSHV